MSRFLQELEADLRRVEVDTASADSPLLEFLEAEVRTDNGPWSLRGHEPVGEIVGLLDRIVTQRQPDVKVTVMKGEQVGVTTFALGFAVWLAAQRRHNTGYFLPDDKFASEWGMSKLNPMIDDSPYLSKLVADARVNRGVLKEFAGKFLYILGLHKLSGATSRPMDAQISDEVDLTSERIRRWKSGRMTHSPFRFELDFSAPYAQNSGIHARYEKGSQRRYLVRCVACGASDICLEESFPECMREFNGTWIRVCPKCHRKLDIVADGRWVPTHPEREKEERHHSYRISAFAIPAIEGNSIMTAYKTALDSGDPDDMAIFNRTKRALPDAGSLQPFTDAVLKRLAQGHDYVLQLARGSNDVFFGVDVGNACWAWFEEWLPETLQPRLLWAEKIHADRWVPRVLELIRRMRPRFGVIDKMPLFTDSRKIAYAHPREVALLQFDNGKDLYTLAERTVVEGTVGEAIEAFGPEYVCAKGDRNILLGQFCAEATRADRGLILPDEQSQTMKTVREHLKKLQKIKGHDARGNEVHQFLDNTENHFGMAAMAARIARLVAPNIQPFSVTTIDDEPRGWGRTRTRWRGVRG